MDLSKPWSGAYATTNSQYGAFDSKAAASMHASSTTAFGKLSITGQKAPKRRSTTTRPPTPISSRPPAPVPRTLCSSRTTCPSTRCSSRQRWRRRRSSPSSTTAWSLADLGDAISKSAPAGTAFDAVGILDHGAPGRFCLLKSVGGGDIDLADLATDASIAAFFKGIGGLVKPGGRIDLLGCSVAAGAEGRALLAQVEALAGVTVAASTDKTGGAADADWEMETHGLNVAKDYFDVEALKEWKHAS